jgi:hypothetical protein
MPLQGEAKKLYQRDYMRDYMRRRRREDLRVLSPGAAPAPVPVPAKPEPRPESKRCSFCTASHERIVILIESDDRYLRAYICEDCVKEVAALIAAQRAQSSEKGDK